jgi:hypothetical protein
MKSPSRGSFVYVEGYGGAVYAGGSHFDDPDNAEVLLKFEGPGLHEGYGRGIVAIPYDEFKQNRVYPEQVADGDPLITSTEKRDAIFRERFGSDHPAVADE